ncbi:DUF1850 domain-containing protein [Halegenticoccus tardaugens]|uniref:DUF1850 domain-containing protein n=1 Tax=Halegenticoccus tardaugens TaxID=2071624 RepID=UPI00100B9375|nr:DUF1850 domain-containing protein [Halegenticoccus tardaugens]
MRGRRVVAAVFALLLVAGAATDVTVLAMEDPRSGETLGVERVHEGDRFAIHYVHSFDETPIHEVYEVRGTSIVQVREEYRYHAIGLEYTEANRTREGNFTVLRMHRDLGSFTVRVAKYTNQTLVSDGRERPLYEYADRWDSIRFSVQRVSYLDYLRLRAEAHV